MYGMVIVVSVHPIMQSTLVGVHEARRSYVGMDAW